MHAKNNLRFTIILLFVLLFYQQTSLLSLGESGSVNSAKYWVWSLGLITYLKCFNLEIESSRTISLLFLCLSILILTFFSIRYKSRRIEIIAIAMIATLFSFPVYISWYSIKKLFPLTDNKRSALCRLHFWTSVRHMINCYFRDGSDLY